MVKQGCFDLCGDNLIKAGDQNSCGITIPNGHCSFTQKHIDKARIKAGELGALNNSITDGFGNFAGYLAEEVVADYFGMEIISCNSGRDKYHNDLQKNNIKFESKTKQRLVLPKPHYQATIARTSLHQNAEYYIFSSVEFKDFEVTSAGQKKYHNPRSLTIIGFISKGDFLKKAVFQKKNKTDISYDPVWGGKTLYTAKRDQYHIRHNELTQAKELFNFGY